MQHPTESPAGAPEPQHFDPFQLMDRFDEEAFSRELEGIASQSELVYVVREGGQEVVGLSKAGVDEACLLLTRQGQVIREEDLQHEILGDGESAEALFKVKAARYAVSPDGTEAKLDQVIGVKRQPLYYANRNNELTYNAHWYEHGAMKASRNARFRLIPGNIRQQVIEAAQRSGQVRVGGSGRGGARREGEHPAPATPQTQASPYAPTEKQVAFYTRLVESHVFTEEERKRALEWLATKATRQTIKDQIDWLKRQVETRKAREGRSA